MKVNSFNLNTTQNSSEIYFEANFIKGLNTCFDSIPTNSSLEAELNSTRVETIPHLSSIMGIKTTDWYSSGNSVTFNSPRCWKYKIMETKFENDELVTRIYRDFFNYLNNPYLQDPVKMMQERLKSQFFEEKMVLGHNDYQINHTIHNGLDVHKIMTRMASDTTKTSLNVTLRRILDYPFERRFNDIGTFCMEMHEAKTDRINVKMTTGGYNSEYQDKIFDAGLLSSSHVYEGAKYFSKHLIPSFMKNKMLIRSNEELQRRFSSTVAWAIKRLALQQGEWYHGYFD